MPFKFEKLAIPEVVLIESEKFEDQRGFFAELYQYISFGGAQITDTIKQINFSKSQKWVLRGLHYQINPFAQGKIVRAVSGKIFDVAVDIRKNSKTFGKWVGAELSGDKFNMLYIPKGFAHGFEVLSDTAEFEYFCTEIYNKQSERGIIYNDPDININWNTKMPIVSQKDLQNPFLKNAEKYND